MAYNSVENAQNFVQDQKNWAKQNGYGDFIIWSNGKELAATLVTKELANIFQRIDLERAGFWKALIFENGHQVEI